MRAWTPEEDKYVLGHRPQESYSRIGAALGRTADMVRNRHRRLLKKKEPGSTSQPVSHNLSTSGATSVKEDGDVAAVHVVSSTIRTLDEAMREAKVDTSIWEVESHTVNKWDQGSIVDVNGAKMVAVVELWQVKIKLRRIRPNAPHVIMSALVDEMRDFSPTYYPIIRAAHSDGERYMFEFSPFDLHIGKLAWGQETGEDYDAKIAEERFMAAIERLIGYIKGFDIERVTFPIGNDMLHVDNSENATTAGTRQDVDTRWQKIFLSTSRIVRAGIDRLRHLAPVLVTVVPGNHDSVLSFTLGHALEGWYHKCPDVTIDNSASPRKYVRYGVSLIGYTHGNEERHDTLPLIMMRERAADVPDVKFFEWHVGHFHKRAERHYTAGDTHTGVVVRTLPSLSGTDAWHHKRGYVKGVRAAEAYLWGRDSGYAGHFSCNFPDVSGRTT